MSDLRLDRLGIGANPQHRIHMVANGVAEKDVYITHTLRDGTQLVTTYRPVHVECNYTARDISPSGFTAWGGLNSTFTFGNGGLAATGKARTLATNAVIQGAGDALNEYTPHFSVLRFDIGVGYAQVVGPTGRGWLTDWSVHGPIGVQPDMLDGMTLFYNNYFDGSPADHPGGAIWLVTKKGAGGALDALHQAADTYPVDVGIGIVGESYANGMAGIGYKVGVQIGGNGSGWKESGASRIWTGIDLSDFIDCGIKLKRHAQGTGPAIAVLPDSGAIVIGALAASHPDSLLEVGGVSKVLQVTADKVGFFGAEPAAQQAGGAATAGVTYSANEQSMIQAMWNALRKYGVIS